MNVNNQRMMCLMCKQWCIPSRENIPYALTKRDPRSQGWIFWTDWSSELTLRNYIKAKMSYFLCKRVLRLAYLHDIFIIPNFPVLHLTFYQQMRFCKWSSYTWWKGGDYRQQATFYFFNLQAISLFVDPPSALHSASMTDHTAAAWHSGVSHHATSSTLSSLDICSTL